LLDDEFFLRLDPGGPRLFRYRSQAALEDVHARYPEKLAELQRLHDALYETSKYLLYHNPARAHAPDVVRQAEGIRSLREAQRVPEKPLPRSVGRDGRRWPR